MVEIGIATGLGLLCCHVPVEWTSLGHGTRHRLDEAQFPSGNDETLRLLHVVMHRVLVWEGT